MPANRKQKAGPLQDIFLKGILVHNPILVQVIGICPVVAAAVSLRAAALLAGIYTLILILTEVIASAFLKKTIRWVRVTLYMLIGLVVISPFSCYLEKNNAGIRITVGIYLSLLAANSLAVLRCEKIAVKNTVKYTFFDSLAASIGYSAVFLLVGFIRELVGNGTIWDKPVRFLPRASGMLMPFGGFIVLGFLAATLRAVVIRRYPQHAKAMMIQINPMPVTLKVPTDPATDKISNDTAEAPVINTLVTEAGTETDVPEALENADPPADSEPVNENETSEAEEPGVQDKAEAITHGEDNPVPSESSEEDSGEHSSIAEESSLNTEQEPPQEASQTQAAHTDTPQDQPEGIPGHSNPDLIDQRFMDLLHFLEECDTPSEGNKLTDS